MHSTTSKTLKVQIRSGNLEGFLNSWFLVLRGMKKEPDIEMMEITFFDAVKDHKSLAEDIAHYKRFGEESSHPDRSYEYLLRCANTSVRVPVRRLTAWLCPEL